MISSFYNYTCTFPKDTEFDKSVMNVEDKGDRWEIYDEGDGAYSETCLEELVSVFGKPLDKVPGLELDLYYECYVDGHWEMTLTIRDGKCTYKESEIHMVERPMSECPVGIAIGTPEDMLRRAEKAMDLLNDCPLDRGECITKPLLIPCSRLLYDVGTYREDIVRDIANAYGVTREWLIGLSDDPHGTN